MFRIRLLLCLVPALLLLGGVALPLFVIGVDRHISRISAPYLTHDLESLPSYRVALVPGCAARLANGRSNLYFHYRIDAAARAWHAGKCRWILVSGDHGSPHYNEPEAMRTALIRKGVPADRIFADYAGFRTLDSVIRLRKVFGTDRALFISQPFHNERAVYLARHHGVELTAFHAKDVTGAFGWKTQLREKLARVQALLDVHLLDTAPRFLGDPIQIGPRLANSQEMPSSS